MNPTATLLSLAVGVVIPGLVALVAKQHAGNGTKALLSALLAAVSGSLTGAIAATPHGWAGWEAVLWQIAIAWVAAGVAYFTGWKPSGAAPAIAKATARFGIGPKEPTPPPAGTATI